MSISDGRRLGHAQRRRIGASSNVYDTVSRPPAFGAGDTVKAKGRYGPQQVTGILANAVPVALPDSDGHLYVVSGGKSGTRQSVHLAGELKPFQLGQSELQ